MEEFRKTIRDNKPQVLLISLMIGLYFFSYFQRVAIPGTIFNELQSELAITASAVTALGAMCMYIYGCAQPFVGLFVDKYGGVRVSIFGGILLFAGSLFFPLCHSIVPLYFWRVVVGLGASTIFLSLVKETDHLFGKHNFPVVMGLAVFIGYSGGLCGTLPFEWTVVSLGWKTSLLLVAGVTGLVTVLLLFAGRKLNDREIVKSPISFRPFLSIISNRNNYPFCYVGAIVFAIYFTFQATVGKKFLEDFVRLSSSKAAAMTFAMMASTMAMTFLAGILSRILGNRRKVFLIFASVASLSSMLMLAWGVKAGLGAWYFLACYTILAISAGFSTIFASIAKEHNPPDLVASSVGVMNMSAYVAVAVMGNAAGYAMECFKSEAVQAAGSLIYPPEAYFKMFIFFAAISFSSFVVSFFIKETYGSQFYVVD